MTMREFKQYLKKCIEVKTSLVRAYEKVNNLGAEYIKQKAKLEEYKDIRKVIELWT